MTHISRKNILLSTLLLSALAVSSWLTQQSFLANDTNISQPNTPNAFMTEAHYIQFNQQGALESDIYSPKVVHYPEDDTTVFDDPRMIAHSDDQLTWIITADHGTSRQGLDVLFLQDNVKILRIKDTDNKTTTLTTTALTAYVPQRFAKTDQPVTITQPGSVVNSVGLTADLKKGEIQLLSQVHGTYEKSAP